LEGVFEVAKDPRVGVVALVIVIKRIQNHPLVEVVDLMTL